MNHRPGPLPPIGEEISAHVSAFMLRRGVNPAAAHATGAQLAELMLMIFAGQRVNFPANPYKLNESRERNEEIRRLFDGTNAPVLAHRFGLSRSRIWQIVKEPGRSSNGRRDMRTP